MEGRDLEYLVNCTILPHGQQLKNKSGGRPMPKLQLRVERKKSGYRTINEESYVRTEGLAGSAKLQLLFCWPCLHFDKDSCSLNIPWVTY